MKKTVSCIMILALALLFLSGCASSSHDKSEGSTEASLPQPWETKISRTEAQTEVPTEPPVVYTPAVGTVYALDTVNIRKEPDAESPILGKLSRNRSITRSSTGDNGWSVVEYEGTKAYISSQYLTENKPASPGELSETGESFAASLKASEGRSQLICVVAEGNQCVLTMHEKREDGLWHQILETDGVIGLNGLYKEKEGDKKTPVGVFSFIKAFGIKEDPGTVFDDQNDEHRHDAHDERNRECRVKIHRQKSPSLRLMSITTARVLIPRGHTRRHLPHNMHLFICS